MLEALSPCLATLTGCVQAGFLCQPEGEKAAHRSAQRRLDQFLQSGRWTDHN